MKERFVFNKYNTDLDKKLRRLHGNDPMQKLVRVVFAAVLIIIIATIVVIMTKNKVQEVKNEFSIDVPEINAEQIKEDIKSGINSGAEDIKNGISSGIQEIFSKE